MEKQEEPVYGPMLPQQSITQVAKRNNCSDEKIEKNEIYGPALPPHLQKKSSEVKSVGPILPQHMREQLQKKIIDPDHSEDSSEDDDIYGPVLPEKEINSKTHLALEERALELKLRLLNPEEEKIQREEWMMELPAVSASKLGLGPRQFRPNAGPDMSDRSSWTDIPNSKKKKQVQEVDLREEIEKSEIKIKDKQQEKIAKKHKRKMESLLDLHQKKKKEDKSAAPKERIPFNRETDLQVNRFDEAQKAAVLKKAQLLDDRFSQGKSKFL